MVARRGHWAYRSDVRTAGSDGQCSYNATSPGELSEGADLHDVRGIPGEHYVDCPLGLTWRRVERPPWVLQAPYRLGRISMGSAENIPSLVSLAPRAYVDLQHPGAGMT